MAKISLPFGLERNNGEAVTDASEIDIVIENGERKHLDDVVLGIKRAIENGVPQVQDSYYIYIESENGDDLLALGQSNKYTFHVWYDWNREIDLTKHTVSWSIERRSSDTEHDKVWATRDKVKNFNGEITIIWSSDPTINDLDPNDAVNTTTFVATATIDGESAVSVELII